MRSFYYVRLVDTTGAILATEEVWNIEGQPIGTPEAVALNAAAFFNTDEHDQNPAGNRVELFGPFLIDVPAAVFDVAEDDRPDAPDFWTVTPALSDDPPQYLARFQGQAWVLEHAMEVDDSRYSFPVTAAELADADEDFDRLQSAAAAPSAVKCWDGPFDIRVYPLEGKPVRDVAVTSRDALDDPEQFAKPWLVEYADGTVIQFDTEAEACELQQRHRMAYDLDEETGEAETSR